MSSFEKYLSVKNNTLYFDGVNLKDLSEKFGTPLIVFSERRLKENVFNIINSFKNYYSKLRIFYAAKANSNLSILKILKNIGIGIEISSYGELAKALIAGFRPSDIVFNGPGKSVMELRKAIELGINCINVDSHYELNLVNKLSSELGKRANIAIRIVPEVEAPYIKTGLSITKFGIELDKVVKTYEEALSLPNIDVRGIHVHLGSQITSIDTWRRGIKILVKVVNELYDELSLTLEHINIGGGLPVNYALSTLDRDITSLPNYFISKIDVDDIAKVIGNYLRNIKYRDITLYLEPGRRIIADAGLLITRVVNYKVRSSNVKWLITDVGFNTLLSLRVLQWYYPVLSINKANEPHDTPYRIGGPLCDSHDAFHDIDGEEIGKPKLPVFRYLPKDTEPGDLLAVLHVGAYTLDVMNNFNGQLKPAAVIIREDGSINVIRRREDISDLILPEITEFLLSS